MLKIGLTYDLKDDYKSSGFSAEEIAEFDSLETIEGVEAAIRSGGFQTDRIGNIKALVRRLAAGEKWDFVFNLAEGLRGMGRESQVPCLLEAYDIPYSFSDPMVLSLCLHKGMTKRVIRDAGVATPDFALVEKAGDAEHLNLPFPLFAKPAAEGTGKGISPVSKIIDLPRLKEVCAQLLEKFRQPVLVETFLPGREFTVGIVGTGAEAEVIGCMEIHYRAGAEGNAYSYINKAEYENRMYYTPGKDESARAAGEAALSAYRVLGCRDGGRVDLREDEAGRPNFIEINPLAGLHPVHSDLPILSSFFGVSYEELLRRIVNSGLKRSGLL
jgi:D-alanine-D-alanine ligase